MSTITTKFPCYCGVDSKQGGRSENQDSYGFCDTPYGFLLLVCDGMGGGPGGKTASTLAVQAIKHALTEGQYQDKTREEILGLAIVYANQILINKQLEYPELRGMGSTCTALLINEESAIVAHIGDSRVYRLRNGQISFRTKDHSKVGEMVRNKLLTEEQARLSAESNIITRAMGRTANSDPEIEVVSFEKGDRFVLCSDGIWGMMPQPELIKRCSEKRQPGLLAQNIAMYVDSLGMGQGGQHDNLTIAILEPNIDSKYKEPMNKKAKLIIHSLLAIVAISIIVICVQQFRISKFDDFLPQLTQLQDSCKMYKDSLSHMQEIIQNEKAKANAVLEGAAKGNEEVVKIFKDEINRLNQEKQNLERKNVELEGRLKQQSESPQISKTKTTTAQPKGSSATNNAMSEIIRKIKGLLNYKDKESLEKCAQSVDQKKKEIVRMINDRLKVTKNAQEKEKLNFIKKCIDEKWDAQITKNNNAWELTPAAKQRIQEILNKIKL